MKFSKKGYLRNSPDVNKPQNIIQGGNITMKGVDFKVHGVDNNGYAKVMTPGYDYNFPNAKYVTETPIKNKEMNGPFKMKPGQGKKQAFKEIPLSMKNPTPLKQEIDPTQLQYSTTNTATTLSGEVVPTGGVATVNIPASRERRSFSSDPVERAKQEQWIADNPQQYQEMIAETKPKEVIVTRARDYSSEVTPDETLYPNPFKKFQYRRYQADQNKRLTAAREGDSLTGAEILKRAKHVYGGTSDPYIASWLQKNKLSVSDKPNVRSGKSSENLSDYKYDIRTGN